MINYYRASVRQSQKEAAAKLRPDLGTDTRHLGGAGFLSRFHLPSLTGTTCPTSIASSVCRRVALGPPRQSERVNKLLIDFFA